MKKYYIVLLSMLSLVGCHSSNKKAGSLAAESSRLMSEGKYVEAIPLIKKASTLNPDCAEYHVGTAMASVMVKDYKTAKDEYLKALPILRKQSQNDPERIDDLYMVLTYLNRDEEAVSMLVSARKRFPENETVMRDYGSFSEVWDEYRIKE